MNYNYRVYLRNFDESKIECVRCSSMEEVEIVLEQAQREDYFSYLIVRHDIRLNMDEPFERGQIKHDINKRLVKKR